MRSKKQQEKVKESVIQKEDKMREGTKKKQ